MGHLSANAKRDSLIVDVNASRLCERACEIHDSRITVLTFNRDHSFEEAVFSTYARTPPRALQMAELWEETFTV